MTGGSHARPNIFFDLDGTLTDPREGILRSIHHALEKLNRPSPPGEELVAFIGPPLKDTFARLLDTRDGGILEEAVEFYREHFAVKGLFENEVYPGIPEALAGIRAEKKTLYVVTSKPTVYARRILEHFDLDRYFAAVYGSELDGTRVHKTDLVPFVLESEGLEPESAILVGDRGLDMEAGVQCGLGTLGVLWGFGDREELLSAGARALCSRPEDLAPALSPSP